MFTNYLKIAWRQFQKNSLYSMISVGGLSIAIAFCLFMAVYLRNEFSFDQWHDQADRIYRVVFDEYDKSGKFCTTPLPIGPALKSELPEVGAMSRITTGPEALVQFENNKYFEKLTFVDTGFTQVFSLKFKSGNRISVLNQPNQVMISERYAKKYFGTIDPMGKILRLGSSGKLNSTVTGVFYDFPENSSFKFDLALSFSTYEKAYGPINLWRQMPNNSTFVRLANSASASQLITKLPAIVQKYVSAEVPTWKEDYILNLQALLDIHLSSSYSSTSEKGDRRLLFLFASIALLVLTVASINYINYATARFIHRAKEVGVRKTVGASSQSLVSQFLMETLLISCTSGVLAVVIAHLLLPIFNVISGRNFTSNYLNHPFFFSALILMILAVGLGAGIFPALYLSGFKPTEALKGKFNDLSLASFSRKGLVVAQFTISVVMIVITLTIWRQMDFIRKSIQPDVGQQIAVFQLNSKILKQYDVLKQKLNTLTGIYQVSAGSNVATFNGDGWPVQLDLNSPKIQMENYAIEDGFVEAMGYKIIAGRTLLRNLTSDVEHGFVINETASKKLGFKMPQEALGQSILWGGDEKKQGIILGVIQDFYFKSMHDQVEPAVLQFAPYSWMTSDFVVLRIDPHNAVSLRGEVQSVISSLDPSWYADLRFLDDNFILLHQKDLQQGQLFSAFGTLAILISCLGLFGLVTFAAEQKRKEIGIRKVLGATVLSLTTLLSKDFLKLVLIANGIAFPIAYSFIQHWFKNFAYRTSMPWEVFAIAGFFALLISLATVSIQASKTAFANPIKSLRTE